MLTVTDSLAALLPFAGDLRTAIFDDFANLGHEAVEALWDLLDHELGHDWWRTADNGQIAGALAKTSQAEWKARRDFQRSSRTASEWIAFCDRRRGDQHSVRRGSPGVTAVRRRGVSRRPRTRRTARASSRSADSGPSGESEPPGEASGGTSILGALRHLLAGRGTA